MNVDLAVKELSKTLMNDLDNDIDIIKAKLYDRNRSKSVVTIRGGNLHLALDNVEKYSILLVSYYDYFNSSELQNSIRSLCGDVVSLLDSRLKNDSFYLLLKDDSQVIGMCCFVYEKCYFGIQAMFVAIDERLKGFGGCFLSLLQDFGRIVDESKNILPIFLMQIKKNTNSQLTNFYAKYFLVKPSNEEDKLLVKQICNESTANDLEYYMILRLPLVYLLKMDCTNNILQSGWKNLITMAKQLTIPSEITLEINPEYSYVEKVINVLLNSNSDYSNWSKANVKQWISCLFNKEVGRKRIGNTNIAKTLFLLDDVGASPIIFNTPKSNDGSNSFALFALRLICKIEMDIQRIYNFMSLACLMISKIISSDNSSFIEEYKEHYEKYFSKKIDLWHKKNNNHAELNIVFKEMSTLYLKQNAIIDFDDYCFIANCFCYDIIALMPVLFKNDYDKPVKYKDNTYFLWHTKITVNKGSFENNKRAVIVVKTSKEKCVLSYKNINYKLNSIMHAEKTFKKRNELYSILTGISKGHPNSVSFSNYRLKKYLNPTNESNFKEIESPYIDWVSRPQHFHINNDLVSVTISGDIRDGDSARDNGNSAVGFLENIKQFFDPTQKFIEIIDVKNDSIADFKWSFNELLEYFKNNDPKRIYNQVSLEISNIEGLVSKIKRPRFVEEIDWIDSTWLLGKEKNYPKIQYYLLTSVEGCYMDYHIDMNGSTVWYHLIVGKKEICLIKPTETNLSLYEKWHKMNEERKLKKLDITSFLSSSIEPKTIRYVTMEPGDTVIIPSGYIHAVSTTKNSVVIGGNFFHYLAIEMQLAITKMEDELGINSISRCQCFSSLCLCAVHYYYKAAIRQTTYEDDRSAVNMLIHSCQKWIKISDSNNYYYIPKRLIKIILKYYAFTTEEEFFTMVENCVNYIVVDQENILKTVYEGLSHMYLKYTVAINKYELSNDNDIWMFLNNCIVVARYKTKFTAFFICPLENEIHKAVPLKKNSSNYVSRLDSNNEIVSVETSELKYNQENNHCLFDTKKEAIAGAMASRFDCFNYRLMLEYTEIVNRSYKPDALYYSILSPYTQKEGLYYLPDDDIIFNTVKNDIFSKLQAGEVLANMESMIDHSVKENANEENITHDNASLCIDIISLNEIDNLKTLTTFDDDDTKTQFVDDVDNSIVLSVAIDNERIIDHSLKENALSGAIDDAINKSKELIDDAIEKSKESIETGLIALFKTSMPGGVVAGNDYGVYIPTPYWIGNLLSDGFEWPVGIIGSFLTFIKQIEQKPVHIFATNEGCINLCEPPKDDFEYLYVVFQENFHYFLYEFIILAKDKKKFIIYESSTDLLPDEEYEEIAKTLIYHFMRNHRLFDGNVTFSSQLKRKKMKKNKSAWDMEIITNFELYNSDCACCALLSVFQRCGVWDDVPIDRKYRRYWVLQKYLDHYKSGSYEGSSDLLNVEGVNGEQILNDTISFALSLSKALNVESNYTSLSEANMSCCICGKKVPPHSDVNEQFCGDILDMCADGKMTSEEALKNLFTVSEIHCDCYKLCHERCLSEMGDSLTTNCQTCGKVARAEYCYEFGELKHVKTINSLIDKSNKELFVDQDVSKNLDNDNTKSQDVKEVDDKVELNQTKPQETLNEIVEHVNYEKQSSVCDNVSKTIDANLIRNKRKLDEMSSISFNEMDKESNNNDDSNQCKLSSKQNLKKKAQNILTSNNKIFIKLVDDAEKQNCKLSLETYDELTYVITYPLNEFTFDIETKTADIAGVHYHNETFSESEILAFQKSWSPPNTTVVKLSISDINRLCVVSNKGEFSASLIKFWMLWISRLSDKDRSDFYICPPDLYSKLMEYGFKYERVCKKVKCNIFEKKMIILPIAFGKKIWSVCVILNPSSLVKPTKSQKKTKSTPEYSIQLFDVSSQSKNELKTGSNCNNICKNVTHWVKHSWYAKNNLKLPINDDVFVDIRKIIPFICKYYFYTIDKLN